MVCRQGAVGGLIFTVILCLSSLAQDYTKDRDFIRRYSQAACEIAQHKIKAMTDAGNSRRLATGGHYDGYFLWDTAFCVVWARHVAQNFPVEESLDNFYRFAESDGYIGRQFDAKGRPVWNPRHPSSFAPPLLAWAELEFHCVVTNGSNERLRRVYPALVRHHRALERFRRKDGLYFSDMLGCGMDDLPRYPIGTTEGDKLTGGIPMTVEAIMPYARTNGWDRWGWVRKNLANRSWNRQIGWIDTTSQVALDCLSLAEIARIIGKGSDVKMWMSEHAELKAAINRLCWNEELGFYCDSKDGKTIPRRHAGGFWVLIARVATPERARRVAGVLADPELFNRPVPLPCLPKGDPDYAPETGYWGGGVWPPTNYIAIRGLMRYGYKNLAEEIARKWYNGTAAMWERFGTVFENYSPERTDTLRDGSDPDFCGWGAVAPIALPREFGWL